MGARRRGFRPNSRHQKERSGRTDESIAALRRFETGRGTDDRVLIEKTVEPKGDLLEERIKQLKEIMSNNPDELEREIVRTGLTAEEEVTVRLRLGLGLPEEGSLSFRGTGNPKLRRRLEQIEQFLVESHGASGDKNKNPLLN